MPKPLSSFATKVLKALNAGPAVRAPVPGDDGLWRARSLKIPNAVIEDLKRADLVVERQGALHLSSPGQRYLHRRAAERRNSDDSFRRQHQKRDQRMRQDPDQKVGSGTKRDVNLTDSPLGWLRQRGLITAIQAEAGARLHASFIRAGLAPRVTQNWDAQAVSRSARTTAGAAQATDAQMAAKAYFDAAIDELKPGLDDIAFRLCCLEEGLEQVESAMGLPKRSGKVVLAIALDRLVAHYGMIAGPSGRSKSA